MGQHPPPDQGAERFCGEPQAGVDSARPVRPRNKANIVLLVADFLRLHGERWLNGELMNSVIVMINEKQQRLHAANRLLDEEVLDVEEIDAEAPANLRSCMFGTYFYLRLVPVAGAYDYDGVRTWGFKNGLDVGSVDRILIPVNVENLHWVLVIVDVKERRFLFFDSLGGRAASVLGMVRRWLTDEVVNRLGVGTAESWNIDSWDGLVDVGLPRQRDGGSCGVFVMAAADCFALGVPLCFSQADMPVLRQRMSLALLVDSLTVEDAAASLPVDVDCSMVDE